MALQWRHHEHDGVSNHRPYHCVLNRLFRPIWRKHQSSASLAFVRGIHRWPVNSPHKGPVTRKKSSVWWRHHGSWFEMYRTSILALQWQLLNRRRTGAWMGNYICMVAHCVWVSNYFTQTAWNNRNSYRTLNCAIVKIFRQHYCVISHVKITSDCKESPWRSFNVHTWLQ